MKLDENEQSENVVHKEDAISDPSDLTQYVAPMFRSGGILSLGDAAVNLGNRFKNMIGYNPPPPPGSGDIGRQVSGDTAGRGFEDGGEVDDVTGALPRVSESENTDETPSSMMGGGQTGASGEQQGPFTPNEQAINTREDALNRSGLGGAFKAAQQGKIASARQENAQGDTSGQGPSEEEQARQSPFSPKGITEGIGKAVGAASNILPGGYGNVARKLSHEIIDYAQQVSGGDPEQLFNSHMMDQNTAGAIVNKVNPDGSHPSESEAGLQYAHDKGGPDAALGFMQNRVANYNSIRAWGAAAFDGNNLQASIDAGNRAFKALPLSENIHFSPGQEGTVTATVVHPDGSDPVRWNLTGSQYRELLRGNSGFPYDLVRDPNAVLAKLASENHDQWADPNSQGVKDDGVHGVVPDNLKALGINQAMFNLSWQMYPWSSQQGQRMQFLAGQVQTKAKYAQELAVAQQQGLNRAQYAGIIGGSREQVAETQAGSREKVAETGAASREKVEGMRGETKKYETDVRGNNYNSRTISQAKTANDKILSSNASGAELRAARSKDIVLRAMDAGTITQEQGDAQLKRMGTSLEQLLAPYQSQQGATQAPQVKGGQGAAQVAQPKGQVSTKNRFQIGVDKNGQPVYQYE
jgi:hypothetical protein